jgi:hypothetical protein
MVLAWRLFAFALEPFYAVEKYDFRSPCGVILEKVAPGLCAIEINPEQHCDLTANRRHKFERLPNELLR